MIFPDERLVVAAATNAGSGSGVVSRIAVFFVYGNSFETIEWVRQVAPRKTVIVSARDDDYVPKEAQQPLLRLAEGDDVELIWTEGRHIKTDRSAELQQLLAIVLRRVLH